MMQKILTKYGLAIHVALVCFYPFAGFGHSRWLLFLPFLWLALAVAELMVLLPSVHRDETLADARRRMARDLCWDPLLYIGVALAGMLMVQWLNGGCPLVYLPDADVWQISAPPVAWAPFCVETAAGFSQFCILVACVAAGLAVRNALSRAPKRMLLQGMAVAGGCVALVSVARMWPEGCPADAASQARGTFFGFWMLLSWGLLADALARFQRGGRALYGFGILANLVGLIFYSPPLSVCLYGILGLTLFLYALVCLDAQVPKKTQVLLFLVTVLALAALVVSLGFLMPDNPVAVKMKEAWPVAEYWEKTVATRRIRMDAALGLWKEHLWFGCGTGGFFHGVGLLLTDKEWALLQTDQAYAYHEYIQILCEYGVVGLALFLAAALALIAPLCYRARIAWQAGGETEKEGRFFLLRISPIVVSGVLATGAVFAEGWIANPFRSPAVLLSWSVTLAALAAFLPRRGRETSRHEGHP
ncbi:MAG: O-antigen ligase family protein [Lentisphaerae bacterium]|nr:O-antigen ligase family protein [Lentisphaerota bacterium]